MITLAELKNDFGEVDKLLDKALEYHKVSVHLIAIITSWYTDY